MKTEGHYFMVEYQAILRGLCTPKIPPNYFSGLKQGSGHYENSIKHYYWFKTYCEYTEYGEKIDKKAFGSILVEAVLALEEDPNPPEEIRSLLQSDDQLAALPEQPLLSDATADSGDHHYSNPLVHVVGRGREQERLADFLRCDGPFRWAQLSGAGGQGKSRLAWDLIQEAREEDADQGKIGWDAGFLRKPDLEAFGEGWKTWRPIRPTLIVFDYVIGSETQIGDAMRALARRAAMLGRHKVRVLLAERQSWSTGGLTLAPDSDPIESLSAPRLVIAEGNAEWFGRLNAEARPGAGGGGRNERYDLRHDAFLFETGLIELRPLELDDLIDIVRDAARSRSGAIALSDVELRKVLERIDNQGRPLFAHLLSSALFGGGYRPNWMKTDLLSWVIETELDRRWREIFKSDVPKAMDNHPSFNLAILATMLGVVDIDRLRETTFWPSAEQLGVSATHEGALRLTASPISQGERGKSRFVKGVEPDILGEWFVLDQFANGADWRELAEIAWAVAPKSMAEFLQRIAGDFPAEPQAVELLAFDPTGDAAKKARQEAIAGIVGTYLEARLDPHRSLVEALEIAANAEDGAAISALALCYYRGIGVEKNDELAFRWWRKGADAEHPGSIRNLGVCYFRGIGVQQDTARALEHAIKAHELGHLGATGDLALSYLNGNGVEVDDAKALEYLLTAVEKDHAWSTGLLAFCYSKGRGVEKNPAAALKLYRKAAEAGDVPAMFDLANNLLQGIGIDAPDPREAMVWYRKAAEAENVPAMAHLAVNLQQGIGIDAPDPREAMVWYRKAAEAENVTAMFNLAVNLQHGVGVDAPDPREAMVWYRKAAEAGEDRARVPFMVCAALLGAAGSEADEPADLLTPEVAVGAAWSDSPPVEADWSEVDPETATLVSRALGLAAHHAGNSLFLADHCITAMRSA